MRPRLNPVGDGEAQKEREGGHDLEIEQRLAAHAAHGFDIAGLGDAHDDRGHQQRHDEALDERDEGLGQKAEQLVGHRMLILGQKAAQQNTQGEAHKNPKGARAIESLLFGHGNPGKGLVSHRPGNSRVAPR